MDPKIESKIDPKLLHDLIQFIKTRKSKDDDVIDCSYEYFGNEDDAYEFGCSVEMHQAAQDLENILMSHGLITSYIDPE